MNFFSEIVNLLEQSNVFLHDSGILLFVNILILLKHLPEVVDIVFQVPSLIGILSMEVSVSLLILHLFLNILLVKPNHTLLKFLEVCNVMQTFENVILELLLVAFLLL